MRRLHRLMVDQTANLPQLSGLFVYDENGRWMVNSRPGRDSPLNNADREYFLYHQSHTERGPHIGVPVVSRSTGRWIIPVSRRLNHSDGSFGGVALATIDIDYFSRFYQSFDIGEHGAVALFNDDGIMLLRRPFNPAAVGSSVRNSPVYRNYIAGRSGNAFLLSGQDGVLRFNSYLPLQHYRLFVTAALSKDEMLEQWRSDTWLHSLGVLLLAVLLGLFGKRLVDQIDLRLQAERELRNTRDALEKLNRTLERQAMQDGLTGLANRRQLDISLGKEFSRALRHHESIAFVMIDVDYFKQYNDRYGHGAGDDCLRSLSKLIRSLAPGRPGDLTARYGGEELGILLPRTDCEARTRWPSASAPPSRRWRCRTAAARWASSASAPVWPPWCRSATWMWKACWCRPPTRRCTWPSRAAATASARRTPLPPARRPELGAAGPPAVGRAGRRHRPGSPPPRVRRRAYAAITTTVVATPAAASRVRQPSSWI